MPIGRYLSWALTIPSSACDDHPITLPFPGRTPTARPGKGSHQEAKEMKSWTYRLITGLLAVVVLAACSSTPEESGPDQDMLDRRDDAIDELERKTR